MQDFLNQNILIGVSGGIAAYKTAHLVRELKKLGATVKVVMTAEATRFVTPLTFQALSGEPVYTSLWDEAQGNGMTHIELARWADVFLVAPTTANLIAKLAHGMADDLLTTLALLIQAPIILCPAMNHSMWSHAATQDNITLLKQRGVIVIDPEVGEAACGETGLGRLCEVTHLIQVLRLYPIRNILKGVPCIITAGPTRERLDPVRYLSNDSAGKMGYALAYAAWIAGAKVILITGPTALATPPGIQVIVVESASDMANAVQASLVQDCLFIAAAAVSDYTPAQPQTQKIKKHTQDMLMLQLKQNPDILSSVVKARLARMVVGFAAETHDVLSHARDKLHRKQCDLIIANQVGKDLGFNQDTHTVTLITSTGEETLPMMHKTRLGGAILSRVAARFFAVSTALKQALVD